MVYIQISPCIMKIERLFSIQLIQIKINMKREYLVKINDDNDEEEK